MNTITPTIPAPVSPQPVVAVQALPEGRQYDLQPYQMVQTTVAEGGQERVLLEFGNQRFWAETPIALQSGQRLQLQVLELHPRLKLQIVEDRLGDYLVRSLHLLNSQQDLQSVLSQLAEELSYPGDSGTEPQSAATVVSQMAAFFSSPESLFNGALLQSLSSQLGLALEAEFARGNREALACLKGALLMTTAGEHQKPELAPSEHHDTRQNVLQTLEMYQLCRARFDQLGCLFLPLPFPFLEQGFLLADRKQSGENDDSPSQLLSLYLQLRGLGSLQINLLYDKDGLFLRFLCDSKRVTAFISSFRTELQNMLSSVLPLNGVSFTEGAVPPVQALAQKLLQGDRGVINERI